MDYTRQVKPLLAERCIGCHGAAKHKADLRLDSAAGIRKGSHSGAVIVPGDSGASLLIKAVSGAKDVSAMPPKGERLSAREIALLRGWIDQGARAPAQETIAKADPARHWSFQPMARPKQPALKDEHWARNGIDRFVLARLEKEGIKPSPEADRVTLIRRLSLDLLGLPPSPKEVDDFLADSRPDAYEQLVDRLLASPHYGERWARHWLDQARYADSNGYSIDAPRSIWKYRDWVIDAISKDVPFDRFATEQLAGDLLPNATQDQRVATGFHRNTQINEEGGIDLEQFRVESIVDRVNTTGSVFLGLTVGCCQCHDHKFDPISQREYYQFYAFFNNVDEPTLELGTPEQRQKRKARLPQLTALEKQLKALDLSASQRLPKWEGSLSPEARGKLPKNIQHILAIAVNGRNARQDLELLTAFRNIDQTRHVIGSLAPLSPFAPALHLHTLTLRRALEARVIELKQQVPVIPTTLVVQERKTPRTTYVQLGGDFLRKGATVIPGTPAVLHPLPQKDKFNRLDFATWLFDRRNPLTARVIVNRFWQAYFGLGLVETENDFGTQGTPPSHPELLDFLGTEFMERGWSMKAMHRLIVTSATYRQSSRAASGLADSRSAQPIAGPAKPAAPGRGSGARRGPGVERVAHAHDRRPERVSAATQGSLQLHPGAARLEGKRGAGPLPPGHVYMVLALGTASGPGRLRRPRRRHHLHAPQSLQHTAAGADLAQRRGVPRVRPRFGGPGAVGSQRRGGKSRPCVPALSGASAQRGSKSC